MNIEDLKKLAGINEFNGYTEYKVDENPSITGTARRKQEKERNLKPGDPEWFKLWFSLQYMTGNQPPSFRGRKKK